MGTLKEEAQAFHPKNTKNIADLDRISLDLKIESREGNDSSGKAFSYKVAVLNDYDYRVPSTVLNDIKTIIANKPDTKYVKVIKKGTGINTDYTTIPID